MAIEKGAWSDRAIKGMSRQEKRRIRDEQIAKGLKDPAVAFHSQRSQASIRGVEWRLTFEEWWGIWADYYHLRGQGRNGLVMAREGDEGPYAVGNVYLTTNLGNLLDYQRSAKAKRSREARRIREYESKPRPLWAKEIMPVVGGGLTRGKNFWNGVEVEKATEDA